MKKLFTLSIVAILLISCDQIQKDNISREFSEYKYEEGFEDVNFDSIENDLLNVYNEHKGAYKIKLKSLITEYDSILKSQREIQRIATQQARKKRDLEKQKAKDSIEKATRKILSPLKSDYDELNNITFYYNTYTRSSDTNLVSIYMGKKDNSKPYLRLKVSYGGEGWIFFDRAVILYGDSNERLEIPFNKYKHKKKDVIGTFVLEEIDVPVSEVMDMHLSSISTSKNAKLFLVGKYRLERPLSNNAKKGIKQVLDAYYKLVL